MNEYRVHLVILCCRKLDSSFNLKLITVCCYVVENRTSIPELVSIIYLNSELAQDIPEFNRLWTFY